MKNKYIVEMPEGFDPKNPGAPTKEILKALFTAKRVKPRTVSVRAWGQIQTVWPKDGRKPYREIRCIDMVEDKCFESVQGVFTYTLPDKNKTKGKKGE